MSVVDWQQESQQYDRAHPRLVQMARLLAEYPERRLLDVGCSTAMLQRLLPDDFVYHGCDVADLAAKSLPADRFLQRDLNISSDLSFFENCRIDTIHIGGVVEYLERPGELLDALRRLVPDGSPLVTSIINFESERYAIADNHHRGWVYRPTLDEFRGLLGRHGWRVESTSAFLGRSGWRSWLFRFNTRRHGVDDVRTRAAAEQFIVTAIAD